MGLQLLKLLQEAPDVEGVAARSAAQTEGPATTDAAADPGNIPVSLTATAPTVTAADAELSLQKAAALVLEVVALMQSNRDMSVLRQALDRGQAQVNAARAHGSGGGKAGGVQDSGRLGGGGGFGGDFGGGRYGTSGIGGGWGARSSSSTSSSGSGGMSRRSGATAPLGSKREASATPQPSSAASPPPLEPSTPPGKERAHPSQPPQPAGQEDAAAAAASAGAAGEWEWRRVRRVVVMGLGSLASYQGALRSGRRTERESTRAAARLYQLALSLVLTSPALLPGLSEAGGSSSADTTGGPVVGDADPHQPPRDVQSVPHSNHGHSGRDGAASSLSAAPPSPAAPPLAAPGASRGPSADNAATAAPQAAASVRASEPAVLYFDPEYLAWDVQLIHSLWISGGTPDVPRSEASATAAITSHVIPDATATATAAPPAALVAHTPTLFYAPCCPREVYDEIVRQNLSAGTLSNVALVGNSLRAQADSALLLQAFGGIASMGAAAAGGMVGWQAAAAPFRSTGSSAAAFPGLPVGVPGGVAGGPGGGGQQPGQWLGLEADGGGGGRGEEAFVELVSQGRVAEVMMPDFAAHGVAVALHLFV